MRVILVKFKDAKPKGQSLVELALIVPLILIMLLGMVEVGIFGLQLPECSGPVP